MSTVVDYAGLYPPAALAAPTVVTNYNKIVGGGNSWMLGRLVWPAARLSELSELARSLAPTVRPPQTEGAWAVTAVTPPAGEAAFADSLTAVAHFNHRHEQEGEPAMRIDSLEIRVASPVEVERTASRLPEGLFPYFEIPWEPDPRGTIAALTDMDCGAKVRTGGEAAAAFPSARQLVRFIAACHFARVPFKATAGLHRALGHQSGATGATHFGFLNVFLGACLLHAGRIDAEGLEMMLADADLGSFDFSERAIAWREASVSIEGIEDARTRFVHSFGSCSFEEPLADLVKLELVAAGVS